MTGGCGRSQPFDTLLRVCINPFAIEQCNPKRILRLSIP